MSAATLTSKWEMVVPRAVRKHMGIQPGDKVDFVVRGGGEVIVRPAMLDAHQIKGILRRQGRKRVSVPRMNQAIRRLSGGRR